jgi:hypothetical protein
MVPILSGILGIVDLKINTDAVLSAYPLTANPSIVLVTLLLE